MQAKPALLLWQQCLLLTVGTESRSVDREKDLVRVCYDLDAAIVPALGPVLFVQNVYHGISPPPQHFPLVQHQLDRPLEYPEHGRVVVQPEFEEFNRVFI